MDSKDASDLFGRKDVSGPQHFAPPPEASVATQPVEIKPQGVYTLTAARKTLRLKPNTLPREIRKGRLRHAKRSGTIFILGVWLLEWLIGGEVVRMKDQPTE
jgi:hypothetical protein